MQMAYLNTTTLPLVCCLLILLQPLTPVKCAVNTEDFQAGKISMHEISVSGIPEKVAEKKSAKEERARLRSERLMSRLEKFLGYANQKKSLTDNSDPAGKWFWIWAVSWGLGILLTIVTGATITGTALGLIWFLSFAIGASALVIWLIKKFA
jgi:hypothetical protein